MVFILSHLTDFMILESIENLIRKQKKEGEFIYPFYEKYCFSNIPSTILRFFNIKTERPILPSELHRDEVEIENCNKILLLLIDGLGYDQWLRYSRDYEFLDVFSQKGVVSPITTVFPSTTAAALTTINSGLTPQEHALLEWFVYFEEIDMIINTLPFTQLGKEGQDRLLEIGADPKILYRGKTIHQTLRKAGVKSLTLMSRRYANSCYSKLVNKGSTRIPFISYSDMAVNLRESLRKEKGPAYFHVYLGNLDSIEHEYGPHTDQYYAELSLLSFSLKTELLRKVDRKTAEETIVLVTSDHGQLNISPEETIYLNRFRKLVRSFQKSRKGKPILPTGSPRDVFLHIEPSKLEETHEFLMRKLGKKARIMKTDEAIKAGLFGMGKPEREFHERVGNLLVIPYENNTIWYEHLKGKRFDLLGHHGGLSEEEMLVPFAIAKLSELM